MELAGVQASLTVYRSRTTQVLFRWSFRRPQSAANLLGPALSEWEKTAVPVVLTFEWTQMVNALCTTSLLRTSTTVIDERTEILLTASLLPLPPFRSPFLNRVAFVSESSLADRPEQIGVH